MQKDIKKIGAHVSAAGGHHKALERASEIGCNCVQLFSGSPRVWKRPDIASIDTEKLSSNKRSLLVEPIFIHSLYLINLASNKPESVQKSVEALTDELQFDALIEGAGVVVHVGSHQGRGFEAVAPQLIESIGEILKQSPATSHFIIENAASRNGKIGGDLSEIAYLLTALEKQGGYVSSGRLGWCVDTCHAHAAGYNLIAGADEKLGIDLSGTITKLKLWDSLRCIHVNDSKDGLGSYRDRHQNLGEGQIPSEGFQSFLQRTEVASIPLITETPGFDGNGPDAENITRLRAFLQ
ncbi:MAG: deoxyribonuclease IV [Patescibacteria group bacterium]